MTNTRCDSNWCTDSRGRLVIVGAVNKETT